MRAVFVGFALLFCLLPLHAEDAAKITDPFDKLPVTLRAETGSEGTVGYFENQIFNMMIWYEGWARQVDIDWAMLSLGAKCLDDNWWAGISAQYNHPPIDRFWLNQHLPNDPAGIYLLLHHRTESLEARFYYPLAVRIDGERFYPWLKIDRLKLLELNEDTALYLTGSAGIHRKADWSLGLRWRYRSLEVKATTSGDFSLGFASTITYDF